MNQFEIDVLNLENKLSNSRVELNNLLYKYDQMHDDNSVIKMKLDQIQIEISYMTKQLETLKSKVDVANENEVASQPTFVTQVSEEKNRSANKEKDIEKMLGKSWMGIVASGLIFLSLIIFAKFISEYITDTVKMIAMYVISVGFAGFGYYKLNKDEHNRFYIALCGCGIGAIYISILMSSIYFKVFNDLTLYLLLFAWVLLVKLFVCSKHVVFTIIGQVGITISYLLGSIMCEDRCDDKMFLVLTIYFVIASLVFFINSSKKKIYENSMNLIFNIINLAIGCGFASDFDSSGYIVFVLGILIAYNIAHIVYIFTRESIESGLDVLACNVIHNALIIWALSLLMDKLDIDPSFALFFVTAIILVLSELKVKKRSIEKIAYQLVSLTFCVYSFYCSLSDYGEYAFGIVGICLVIIGFFKSDWVYKFYSLFMMLIHLFAYDSHTFTYFAVLIMCLLYLGVIVGLSKYNKEQYSLIFKNLCYLWTLYAVFASVCQAWLGESVFIFMAHNHKYDIVHLVLCIIIGIANILLERTRFIKNPFTGLDENISRLVLKGVHVLIMIRSLYLLDPMRDYNVIAHFICIIWLIVLFMINSSKLLKKNSAWGVYIGIKFSILLLTIMISFDSVSIFMSIGFFILAIACIISGFVFKCKGIRLYGLVIANLSVLKLIFVDISFDGLGQLSLCLFISGLLCFAISMIYNNIDKRLKQNEG